MKVKCYLLFSSFFTSRSRVRRLVHVIRRLELELVAPYYSAVYCYEMIAFVAEPLAEHTGHVRRDLQENNRYWAAFETKMAEVSEQVYETFLRTYGDDRGMQSYGACVDLLVMYYGGEAAVD